MLRKISLMIASAAILSSCTIVDASENSGSIVYKSINNSEIQNLDKDVVSRTGYKAIEDLASYFEYSESKNYILSPASYLLAEAGLVSVSDGCNNNAFGFADDVNNDLNSLLNAWNYDYKNEHSGYASYFKSAVLHQQIGTKYPFDNSKREAVSQNHISTIVSSSNSYNNDAKSFFKENIGLEIDIPPLPGSQIITYAGIKIKDDAVIGMTTARHRFHVSETETVNVDCYDFSNTYEYLNTKYYKGETYEAFTINLYETSLLIILPNSGVNISSINVSEAYQSFLLNNTRDILTGYVPYFHIKNEEVDLTDSLTRKFTGKESFYSKLLSDDVKNDLKVSAVLQSSDFEFNEKGISGESVTEIGMDGSSEGGGTPQAREIYVNRPFYAISLKDDFPVFVSRVDNPSI